MAVDAERQDPDGELVARSLRGDGPAFDALVLRHRQAVYRLAYRLLGNHEEADDVSQEAFVRAFRSLSGFRGDASFRTWITRITINVALGARHARIATVPIEQAPAPRKEPAGPEAALRSEVRVAVGFLPPRQRQVLVLKVYEGMKFAEIAQAAGMSIGTAKATFFQAVQNLRNRLAPRTDPRGGGA